MGEAKLRAATEERTLRLVIGVFVSIAASALSSIGCSKPPSGSTLREQAQDLCRRGETDACLRQLQALSRSDPDGRIGDEARLALASALLADRRPLEALDAMQPVVKHGVIAPDYAVLLLARAQIESGLREEGRSIDDLLESVQASTLSPVVMRSARTLRMRLAFTSGRYSAAAALADELAGVAGGLGSGEESTGEALWIAGESYRLLGNRLAAVDRYGRLWYGHPEESHADAVLGRLRELKAHRSAPNRPRDDVQMLAFLRRLQAAGFHSIVLEELVGASLGSSNPEGIKLRVESLRALRRNSECVQAAERLRHDFPSTPAAREGGVLAIRCLRRTDDVAGVRSWVGWLTTNRDKANTREDNTAVQATYELGGLLVNTGNVDEGVDLLLSIPGSHPENALCDDALWRVAWARRTRGDTTGAVEALQRLLAEVPTSGFRKAALYWIGRFSERTDVERAKRYYSEVIRSFSNDYYGFEAARNLQALGGPTPEPGFGKSFPVVDPLDDATKHPNDSAYVRAVSLSRLGLYDFAAQELALSGHLDDGLEFSLASLLSKAGRTGEAMDVLSARFPDFVAAGSRQPTLVPREFWRILYPNPFRRQIERAVDSAGLRDAQIDGHLVAALIRMESRFDSRAKSKVGAIGLMQLLPETAGILSHERTGRRVTAEDLFVPDVNIQYGSLYLAKLVQLSNGDWFRAICSYNAGPGAVDKWGNASPRDEFIEMIPFVDTRIYLKQVLGNYWNYQWIYAS